MLLIIVGIIVTSSTITPNQFSSSSNIVPSSTDSISTGKGSSLSSASSAIQIHIKYNNAWSGTYGDTESMRSIDGTGERTITIDNPTFAISCVFQKKDGSNQNMVVEIIKNGKVIKTGSTTTAYGAVAVASTTSGSGQDSILFNKPTSTVQIRVNYDGAWHGAYGEIGSLQSVDGTGPKTYTMNNVNYVASANFQKMDGSSNELSVEIVKDGTVIKRSSTTAAYGVAMVSSGV